MATIETKLWTKRNGVRHRQLEIRGDTTPTITCSNDAEIKVRFNVSVSDKYDLNYTTDTLIPYFVLNGTEYQLGEFTITGSTKVNDGTHSYYDISAFDITYFCKKYRVEGRVFFPAGTLYTTAIAQMLTASRISNYEIDPSNMTLTIDREDWDPGTPYITIINDLLYEINYNSVYLDSEGIVRCTRYASPTSENITVTYNNDPNVSIIFPGSEIEVDAFDHPNVFYYITENPDLPEPLTATAENSDPTNMFSTVNQGRIVEYVKIDNVANQQTLQSLANRAVTESMFSNDLIRFTTGIGQIHNPFAIVSLKKNEFVGVLAEQEWTMQLGNNPTFEHVGKRVIL